MCPEARLECRFGSTTCTHSGDQASRSVSCRLMCSYGWLGGNQSSDPLLSHCRERFRGDSKVCLTHFVRPIGEKISGFKISSLK